MAQDLPLGSSVVAQAPPVGITTSIPPVSGAASVAKTPSFTTTTTPGAPGATTQFKEDTGEGLEDLPDRPVSEHRNLVTPQRPRRDCSRRRALNAAYAEAQTSADRAALQKVARDLRYWSQRLNSAELMPAPVDTGTVHFGSRVTLLRADGRRVTYRIVGEDEADPAKGTISHVSPPARALIGKTQGDTVPMGATTAEIERIA